MPMKEILLDLTSQHSVELRTAFARYHVLSGHFVMLLKAKFNFAGKLCSHPATAGWEQANKP